MNTCVIYYFTRKHILLTVSYIRHRKQKFSCPFLPRGEGINIYNKDENSCDEGNVYKYITNWNALLNSAVRKKSVWGGVLNLFPIDQFKFIAIDRAVYTTQINIF